MPITKRQLSLQSIQMPEMPRNYISLWITLFRYTKIKMAALRHRQFVPLCNGKATRFYKEMSKPKLEETFIINQPQLVTIGNPSSTACKTHLNDIANNSLNESPKAKQITGLIIIESTIMARYQHHTK